MVSEAIEPYRRDKEIKSSLESVATFHFAECYDLETEAKDGLAELFIVSEVRISKSTKEPSDVDTYDFFSKMGVKITKTTNHKCGRCWRLLPEVSEDGALCGRCEKVVDR